MSGRLDAAVRRLCECTGDEQLAAVLRQVLPPGARHRDVLAAFDAAERFEQPRGRPAAARLIAHTRTRVEHILPTLSWCPSDTVTWAMSRRTAAESYLVVRRAGPQLCRGMPDDLAETVHSAGRQALSWPRRLRRIRRLALVARDWVVATKTSLLLAEISALRGDWPDVSREHARAVQFSRRAGHPTCRVEALVTSAIHCDAAGGPVKARHLLAEAITMAAGHDLGRAQIPLDLEAAENARLLDDQTEALDHAQAALALAEGFSLPGYASIAATRVGELLNDLGRYDEAEAPLWQAIQFAERATGPRARGQAHRALRGLVVSARERGSWLEAERLAGKALEAVNPEDRWERVRALNMLASVQLARGSFQAALLTYLKAVTYTVRTPDGSVESYDEAESWFGVGDAYLAVGEEEHAHNSYSMAFVAGGVADPLRAHADLVQRPIASLMDQMPSLTPEAFASWRNAADHLGMQALQARLSDGIAAMHSARGEFPAAVAVYESAIARHRTQGDASPFLLRMRLRMAGVLERDPDTREQARDVLEEAVQVIERSIDDVAVDERRAEIIAQWSDIYGTLIDLLLSPGQSLGPSPPRPVERAWDLHEAVRARTFLAELSLQDLPAPAGAPPALLERERTLVAIERETQAALRTRTGPERVFVLKRLREVNQELDECWARLEPVTPRYVRLRRAQPVRLEEVRAALRASGLPAALVSFHCSEQHTTAFVVRPDTHEIETFRSAVGRSRLSAALHCLRRAYNGDRSGLFHVPPPRAERPWEKDRDLGPYHDVVPEVLSFLPALEGLPLVLLVPHGPLHGVPFHAMRGPDGEFLAARHAVVYNSSVSALVHLLERAPSAWPPQALYVAATAAAQDDQAAFESDLELIPAVPWRSVDSDLGPQRASKDRVLSRMAGHDVVHLTCHGYVDETDPLGSGLLLSDGLSRPPAPVSGQVSPGFLLTAREILATGCDASLVTLRACSSGFQSVSNRGDELLGLTRALLYSGAAALLVNLWNVDRDSSRELVHLFYREWLSPEHRTPAWQAMWRAQQIFLDKEPRSPLRHPYHWAPLTLIGDPR